MMQESKEQRDIALIKQDLTYIKQDMAEIKASLKLVLEHYVTRQEIEAKNERIQIEMDKRFDGVHIRIDRKADKEDFLELRDRVQEDNEGSTIKWAPIFQSVITTILTTAIVGGLLYFNLR